MNITQKQRISSGRDRCPPGLQYFCLCSFCSCWCRLLCFSLLCYRVFSPSPLCFSSFILWLFYPCSNEESFLFCIEFLPTQTFAGPIWGRTSERWDKGHKPKQSVHCRNFGLVQSLFFNSLFRLRNNKTELYALHMFCRPSSQLFENGYEHPELNCIASLHHIRNHCSVSLPGSTCSVT